VDQANREAESSLSTFKEEAEKEKAQAIEKAVEKAMEEAKQPPPEEDAVETKTEEES
jgi:hypothetical protein